MGLPVWIVQLILNSFFLKPHSLNELKHASCLCEHTYKDVFTIFISFFSILGGSSLFWIDRPPQICLYMFNREKDQSKGITQRIFHSPCFFISFVFVIFLAKYTVSCHVSSKAFNWLSHWRNKINFTTTLKRQMSSY